MNIQDLKYLVAVHDLSNFSKAAKRCLVSQPTLSGQLKKLESELGSTLIERSTRRVMFTALGNQVVSQAREVLQGVERIQCLVSEREDPMIGEFHIGLIPTIGPFLLPLMMPELSVAYPSATLFIYEQKADVLLEKMLRGELDAVVLSKSNRAMPLVERHLYCEEMKLAISTKGSAIVLKNELNGVKNVPEVLTNPTASGVIDSSALLGQPFLLLEDGHCLRDTALSFCSMIGATENKAFRGSSIDSLLHMVATGTGLTLIPDLASRRQMTNVEFRSISGKPAVRDVVMVTRKNGARADALDKLADVIEQTVSALV